MSDFPWTCDTCGIEQDFKLLHDLGSDGAYCRPCGHARRPFVDRNWDCSRCGQWQDRAMYRGPDGALCGSCYDRAEVNRRPGEIKTLEAQARTAQRRGVHSSSGISRHIPANASRFEFERALPFDLDQLEELPTYSVGWSYAMDDRFFIRACAVAGVYLWFLGQLVSGWLS